MKLSTQDEKALLKGFSIKLKKASGAPITEKEHLEFSKACDKFEEKVFLDFVNNFLTVSRFASHYDLTDQEANSFLQRQYRLSHNLK